MTHHVDDDELEQQVSDDSAEELGDPVKNPAEDSDVTADQGPESDGRVEVAAGDVGGGGDTDEKGKAMS